MGPIVISGYYGCGNAGDEAILAGLLAGLHARLGEDCPLVVLSGNPQATRAQHGVAAAGWRSPTIPAVLARASGLVSGGGGLFQDATGPMSPLYYGGLIGLARLLGKRVVVVGQGVGPLTRPLSRLATRWALRRCRYVAVRDEDSRRLLANMGLRAELGADLAYLLPLPSLEVQAAAWEKVGGRPQGPVVGVSLRPMPARGDLEPLLAACAAALATLKNDTTVLLLPFQPEADRPLLVRLAEMLPLRCQLPQRGLAPDEIMALCAGLQVMVGMRLHALLLAARAGTAVVGISYDPKVDAFLQRLGLRATTGAQAPDPQALTRAVAAAAEGGLPAESVRANAEQEHAAGQMLDAACRQLTCRD